MSRCQNRELPAALMNYPITLLTFLLALLMLLVEAVFCQSCISSISNQKSCVSGKHEKRVCRSASEANKATHVFAGKFILPTLNQDRVGGGGEVWWMTKHKATEMSSSAYLFVPSRRFAAPVIFPNWLLPCSCLPSKQCYNQLFPVETKKRIT